MNIQENSFDYHRESYIIIKNHKKSWKVIEDIFIYINYFQHVIKKEDQIRTLSSANNGKI